MRRSEVDSSVLRRLGVDVEIDPIISEPVEIEVKYAGYIFRQNELIEQTQRLEKLALPSDLNYGLIRGLSHEEIEKLSKLRPLSLGQAQRISGVNPSAIQAVLVHLKGRRKLKELGVGN